MEKIKKVLNFKIISLALAVTFLLQSTVYGIDLPYKTHLRVPSQVSKEGFGKRFRSAAEEINDSASLPIDSLEVAYHDEISQFSNPFPIRHFKESLRTNAKIFDFGIGKDCIWGLTLLKEYSGLDLSYFGVDNGEGVPKMVYTEEQIKRHYEELLESTEKVRRESQYKIYFRKQSYLDGFPKEWGKADVVILNFPNVTQKFLQDVIISGRLANAIYENLKIGGVALILSEAHMYLNDTSIYYDEKEIVQEEMMASFKKRFGNKNVIETEIPRGYFESKLISYAPLARKIEKNRGLRFFFMQVRKLSAEQLRAKEDGDHAIPKSPAREHSAAVLRMLNNIKSFEPRRSN